MRVGVELPGSSSHSDIVEEELAFEVTNNSTQSAPFPIKGQKLQFLQNLVTGFHTSE